MGLDIYCHRVKKSVADAANNNEEIYAKLNELAKEEFAKTSSKMLKKLQKEYDACSPIEYAKVYEKFVMRLQKVVPFYRTHDFYLKKYGYNSYTKEFSSIKTPNEVETIFTEELKHMFAVSDSYFRKVNFIYEFYRNELVNEECLVSKGSILELIETCKDVLSHKGDEEYAEEHLPTTGGFFFGSTNYDKWYWEDVKDCLKQMEKLYKTLEDDDLAYWIFSW